VTCGQNSVTSWRVPHRSFAAASVRPASATTTAPVIQRNRTARRVRGGSGANVALEATAGATGRSDRTKRGPRDHSDLYRVMATLSNGSVEGLVGLAWADTSSRI